MKLFLYNILVKLCEIFAVWSSNKFDIQASWDSKMLHVTKVFTTMNLTKAFFISLVLRSLNASHRSLVKSFLLKKGKFIAKDYIASICTITYIWHVLCLRVNK